MRIACVHQGYELYGSDRSFAESVAALRAAFPSADIEVVLPRSGPIVQILEPHASRIVFEPLWVLRRQAILRLATVEMARLPLALWRAWRRLRQCDLVYVNTSIVADYALAARLLPHKAVLHIHEIPEGFMRTILVALMRWSHADLIFNSRATRAAFGIAGRSRTHVVYNGVAGPPAVEPMHYDGSRPLRVLLLGRINRIKGQEVLLEAVASMPPELRSRIEVRLVGGAFESTERELALAELVNTMGLADRVSVLPFIPDPSQHYHWADIVTVPSRRPESLGRVAIEAMAYGRPPLVSAIGGLVEVVSDGETGWHVPPNNAAALAAKLQAIILRPEAWRGFVAAGRARYETVFSEPVAAAAIAAIAADKLKVTMARPGRPATARQAETRP
ncbi:MULTISPECIES: glycosyltransferase family 4 protein [unclassified Mesorhizobium]|uniref:glycosyltransferase family 4 protein n=1 Tax=unclassified Mesorhizobium TaxID=325217 RepID=UPI00112D57D9|nr:MULTISPECIES: glycosyltransferase family 4 protein [unclassified Mesorhizobium]MBZ9701875.1 glycosyltransferase family 4 protein [Mesorhizobium sp. CO1-1-3]MBZ9945308.1 glycosyltransferase family 4 protein [Mesorhizobium sp. BR1-1-11]TPJ07789.1 glycosyltransferase family 4 protein [Mesorhizobium sp. B2-8-1]TPM23220.1 glycosyltransferase family 4 protein [Mesorhizobium sp. B2-3-6]